MTLTKDNKIFLISTFGVCILTILAHIGIKEYYKPYIQYTSGSYYMSGESAITFMSLKNTGEADAEEIKFNVSFDSYINNVVIDDRSLSLKIIEGGNGNSFTIGELTRLVPGQQVYIYFSIVNKDTHIEDLRRDFIKSITFKGGKGKTSKKLITLVNIALWTSQLFLIYIAVFMLMTKRFPFVKQKKRNTVS